MKKIDFSSLDERLDAKVDSIRRRIGAAFYYPEAKALEANIKASEACIKRLENELERLRAALDQKNEEIAIKDKQAGNSIVVDVLVGILGNLLGEDEQ